VNIDGATNYVTASPCWHCFKQLANAGIMRICYGEFYRDDRIFEIAQQIKIELVHVPLPGVQLPKMAPAVD
jgi:dCMP deaminase